MLSFIGRSLIQKIITLFFVSIVSFLIVYLAPEQTSVEKKEVDRAKSFSKPTSSEAPMSAEPP